MSKNLAIIDADSICYLGGKEDSLQQILEKVDNKIQEILLETKADFYLVCLSRGKYFRHNLTSKETDTTYKGQRTYDAQPWKQFIKEYLTVKYNGFNLEGVEADDILSWLKSKTLYYGINSYGLADNFVENIQENKKYLRNSEEINIILASKDKDILGGIPGKHLNYSKKSGDEWIMEWVETSEEAAELFFKYQLIFGDVSDNIITPFPENCAIYNTSDVILTIPEILDGYINGLSYDTPKRKNQFREGLGLDKGIQQFRLNYLLLKMIDSDEMFLDRVSYIPDINQIPFQKVSKPLEKEIKINF